MSFLLDGLLIAFSLYAANLVRPFLSELPFVADFPDPVVPLPLYPAFSLLWPLILLFFAVYDGRGSRSFGRDWLNLTGGSLLAGVALAGLLFLNYREISRVQFLIFFMLAYLCLVAWRLAFDAVWRKRARARRAARVLVIGDNPVGQEIGG